MDHLVDFCLAVLGLRSSEFTDEDGLMSDMMEIVAHESALREGGRSRLPIEEKLDPDAIGRKLQRDQFGVNPLGVEAMLSVCFPRP